MRIDNRRAMARSSGGTLLLVGRRLAQGILTVCIILCVVFLLGHAIGDPTKLLLGPSAPPSQYAALRHQLGLDRPLIDQFATSFGSWIRGDFGQSVWMGVPALPLVLSKLPATLYIAGLAIAIAVPSGVALGALAGSRVGSVWDGLVGILSALAISTAQFWLGMLLVLVLAVNLHLLPPSGYGGIRYAIMPSLTLAALSIGRIAQVSRAAIQSEMRAPYVDAGRTRGLPMRRLFFRSILRNASIPIITVAGTELASMVDGAIVVATVFSWPGMGLLLINAIEHRDLPVVEACVFVIAGLIICLNILVDLFYSFVDARVRA